MEIEQGIANRLPVAAVQPLSQSDSPYRAANGLHEDDAIRRIQVDYREAATSRTIDLNQRCSALFCVRSCQ